MADPNKPDEQMLADINEIAALQMARWRAEQGMAPDPDVPQVEGAPHASLAQPAATPQQTESFNVGEAQGLMRMMGFDTGPVDNDMGPKTTAALDAYRAQHNIADGASMNDVMAHMREQVQSDPKVIANMATALRDGANGQMDVNDARAIQAEDEAVASRRYAVNFLQHERRSRNISEH